MPVNCGNMTSIIDGFQIIKYPVPTILDRCPLARCLKQGNLRENVILQDLTSSRLYSVGIVMGSEHNELDGLIRHFPTIRAGYYSIIAFFPAHFAIQVNDDEIALHWT